MKAMSLIWKLVYVATDQVGISGDGYFLKKHEKRQKMNLGVFKKTCSDDILKKTKPVNKRVDANFASLSAGRERGNLNNNGFRSREVTQGINQNSNPIGTPMVPGTPMPEAKIQATKMIKIKSMIPRENCKKNFLNSKTRGRFPETSFQ